jgi:hypothetical protein
VAGQVPMMHAALFVIQAGAAALALPDHTRSAPSVNR